jgi:hypothetical protein
VISPRNAYGRMSSHRIRHASGGRFNLAKVNIAVDFKLFNELRALALKNRTSISAIAREALRVGIHGIGSK